MNQGSKTNLILSVCGINKMCTVNKCTGSVAFKLLKPLNMRSPPFHLKNVGDHGGVAPSFSLSPPGGETS